MPRARRSMMPSANDKSPLSSFGACFRAAIRCVLALAVLLAMVFDPVARAGIPWISHPVLGLYVAYSVLLYTATRWGHPILPATVEPWLDVGWAVGLTVLSSDPGGIFAGFLVFAMFIAACQWGLTPGLRIALVVALLTLSLGIARWYGDSDAGIRHVLMSSAAIGVLGYMTACFGKQELRHQRRLTLLKDVSRLSNPRFGIDRTLGMLAERLRAFYDADACLLITPDACRKGYQWRRAERHNPDGAVRAEVLPAEWTRLLLAWPDGDAVIFSGRHGVWQRWRPKACAEVIDLRRGMRRTAGEQLSDVVAEMLDATAFITVPLSAPDLHGGRLYITAGNRGAFDPTDVEFLLLVVDHTVPVLQNITLVDQIASDAAEAERQRIALDFHDRVIQPYIGLQIGLAAIRQKLGMGDTDVTHDINRLLDLTKDELTQLRRLVQGLKRGGERVGSLVPAIRRFGRKFTAATGIQVQLEVTGEPHVDEHLAAEVFSIVTEGLSNIRRHTLATTASITLVQEKGQLSIQIRNDGMEGEAFVPFTPRSITERTTALGGEVRVERQGHSHAAVIAEIPL